MAIDMIARGKLPVAIGAINGMTQMCLMNQKVNIVVSTFQASGNALCHTRARICRNAGP